MYLKKKRKSKVSSNKQDNPSHGLNSITICHRVYRHELHTYQSFFIPSSEYGATSSKEEEVYLSHQGEPNSQNGGKCYEKKKVKGVEMHLIIYMSMLVDYRINMTARQHESRPMANTSATGTTGGWSGVR